MGTKSEKNNLIETFKSKDSFTVNDLYSFFAETEKDIKRTTVNWRIHELANQGTLKRIGRGCYTLGNAHIFLPRIDKRQKSIASLIKNNFPLIHFCIWSTSVLGEFYQHISKSKFLIVEVEKDAVDPVYYLLRNEIHAAVLKKPSASVLEDIDFVPDKDPVIVNALISEAPFQTVENTPVPTLEKILVDLYADTETFYYLQGNEMMNMYSNAFEKYTINRDRLMRYAKRRNKDAEIGKIVLQMNRND